ncbi:MAG TPA: GNAT family N-acetyltransferase [Chthoniobacterales bacterium]|nr:GNAT family N-acetyltransferase [Chthoniobacterales bacterium]
MTRAAAAVAFDLQPTLVGQLLELRPIRPDDYEGLFAAASDRLIWEQHPESDRYTPEIFRRYFDGAISSGGAFVIIERASGRIIGSSRYHGFDPIAREVEIGWTFLERKFWGGVYNRELKDLMLGHAFKFVDKVLFIVGENNLRSRKAVEKIGGKLLRTIERPDRNGRLEKNVVFGLDRSAWRKN